MGQIIKESAWNRSRRCACSLHAHSLPSACLLSQGPVFDTDARRAQGPVLRWIDRLLYAPPLGISTGAVPAVPKGAVGRTALLNLLRSNLEMFSVYVDRCYDGDARVATASFQVWQADQAQAGVAGPSPASHGCSLQTARAGCLCAWVGSNRGGVRWHNWGQGSISIVFVCAHGICVFASACMQVASEVYSLFHVKVEPHVVLSLVLYKMVDGNQEVREDAMHMLQVRHAAVRHTVL